MPAVWLRSAPYLFNQISEALHWILDNYMYQMEAVNYLDDFLVVGAPGTDQCSSAVQQTLSACESLGIPVAFDKLEGPSTRITFLGIMLDTEARVMSLPQGKLVDIQSKVHSWLGRCSATKCELLAPFTAATYRVGIQRYLAFCSNLHVRPVPASKHLVAAFATHLWSTVTLPTIKVYLAAVSFLYHSEGLQSPVRGNQILRLLLSGIRRSNLASSPKSCCRHPLCPEYWLNCSVHHTLADHSGARTSVCSKRQQHLPSLGSVNWRVHCHTHTPVSLSKGVIQLGKHELQIRLGRSKTDQWGKGAHVKIGCS